MSPRAASSPTLRAASGPDSRSDHANSVDSAISGGEVRRPVVDDDRLVRRVPQLTRSPGGNPQPALAIVRADDDRHEGTVRPRRAFGTRVRRGNGTSAGLGRRRGRSARSASRRTSSSPRCHSSVQAKTNAPAQPGRGAASSCDADVPPACGPVAPAVGAELREHERLLAGEVLQPR